MLPICTRLWGHPLGHGQPVSSQPPKKNDSPLRKSSTVNSPWARDRGPRSPSLLPAGIFDWFYLVQVTTVAMCSCVQQPCPIQHFLTLLPILCLLRSAMFPEPCRWLGLKIDAPSYSRAHSRFFPALGTVSESALTAIHCDKKLLSPRLREAQIYGYKHKFLEGNLTAWSFSKTISTG